MTHNVKTHFTNTPPRTPLFNLLFHTHFNPPTAFTPLFLSSLLVAMQSTFSLKADACELMMLLDSY